MKPSGEDTFLVSQYHSPLMVVVGGRQPTKERKELWIRIQNVVIARSIRGIISQEWKQAR